MTASTELDNYPREGGLTAVQETICRRVMEGESINRICQDDALPSKSTVFNWLASDVDFRTAYWLAKMLYSEIVVEEALEIADAAPGMVITQTGEDRIEMRVDTGAVQHAKLRVDTRKWLAGKLNPRRYGDASMLRLGDLNSDTGLKTVEDVTLRLAAIFAAYRRKED